MTEISKAVEKTSKIPNQKKIEILSPKQIGQCQEVEEQLRQEMFIKEKQKTKEELQSQARMLLQEIETTYHGRLQPNNDNDMNGVRAKRGTLLVSDIEINGDITTFKLKSWGQEGTVK